MLQSWRETTNTWGPLQKEWPQLVADFELAPERTALVVVDVQEYNTKPMGDLIQAIVDDYPPFGEYYFPRMANVVIPNIRRLLDFFRSHQLRVIFLKVGPYLDDGADMPAVLKGMGLLRRKGLEIVDELTPIDGEIVLRKNSYSAFTSTNIDQVLKNMGVTDLVITGVTTDGCVETSARDAADHGYNCYLIEDACGTLSESIQQGTMESFVLMFGKVRTVLEVIDELSATLGVPADA